MMEDLAMQCLDIAYNSVRAKASLIQIKIHDSELENITKIIIEDNGCGMTSEQLAHVSDPFYTTRSTRKIGLGVSFFKGLASQCNGTFQIESTLNVGTKTQVSLQKDHWDRPPLGNLAEMVTYLVQAEGESDVYFQYTNDQGEVVFDTRVIKEVLEGVKITEPEILIWIRDSITDEFNQLCKK